jgi:SAM-dependent methyltransferase
LKFIRCRHHAPTGWDALPMSDLPFTYSGTELDAMAEARNYYAWILQQFAPHLGTRTIEVGAGIGTFSDFLLDGTDLTELTLVEPAENLLPFLRGKFAADPRVKVMSGYLEDSAPSPSVDSVIAINVLEHVEYDVRFLKQSRLRLREGGALLLFTPALSKLYGSLDEAFGHYRRYSKRDLENKLRSAGFEPECIRYFNLPGVVTWFLAGRVFQRKTIRPRDARLYDRWVVPWVSRLETLWAPPVGQSLMAIATNRSE